MKETLPKLRHFKLQLNLVISDNGLINGLFTHCSHIESLLLFNCFKVTGSFLAILPHTVKRLAFVSVSFVNLFIYNMFRTLNVIFFF